MAGTPRAPRKPKVQRALAWAADKVERRSVESLVPYARNSRTHSDEQVAQIAAAIKEWGWTIPVLIDEEGVLIAGHGRIMAAKLLGIEEVPAMTAVGWTDAQKRAYVIADNKLAENAGWDEEALKGELSALSDLDFDLGLTGFDVEDLVDLLHTDDGEGDELVQLEPANSQDSKMLKLRFGRSEVPLTQEEHDWLFAKLEGHLEKFGMPSGFVANALDV